MNPPEAVRIATVAAGLPDPAWASPFNLLFLICLTFFAAYFAREVRLLREQAIRIARGSEDRAVNAAREITVTKDRVEMSAAEVVVLARAIKDEMRRFHGEWARLDEAQREMGLAILRERPLVDGSPAITPSPGGMP